MADWTLADLTSRATQALGNRTDISISDASFWANEAMKDVIVEVGPSFLEETLAISSTTCNEDKISLPTDFYELLAISNLSSGVGGTLMSQLNIDQNLAYSDLSGVPESYQLYSTWLELFPIPDSAYSLELRYLKQPSAMTELTCIPSVATRYRKGIFFKTKEYLAGEVIYDYDAESKAHNQYVNFMNSVPNDQALRMRNQHYAGCSLPRGRGQKGRSSELSWTKRVD